MTTLRSTDRSGMPPPRIDLTYDGRAVGWIADDAVGFRGFADVTEAAHAAWLAYRALARRLERTHDIRPLPVEAGPLALERRGDRETISTGGRPIATLVRPDVGSPSGADGFGFEIRVPAPADALRVRSVAHLMYRALRAPGLRWALWDRAETVVATTATRAGVELAQQPRRAEQPRSLASGRAAASGVARWVFAAVVLLGVMALAATPATVASPLALAVAVGLLVAALDRRRERRRPRRPRGLRYDTPRPRNAWGGAIAPGSATIGATNRSPLAAR